jgi:hypothetical protein
MLVVHFLEKKNAFLRAVCAPEENSSAQNFRPLNFRRTGRASVGVETWTFRS